MLDSIEANILRSLYFQFLLLLFGLNLFYIREFNHICYGLFVYNDSI